MSSCGLRNDFLRNPKTDAAIQNFRSYIADDEFGGLVHPFRLPTVSFRNALRTCGHRLHIHLQIYLQTIVHV